MATLLHALAALVFGDFRFASFFERAHSECSDSRGAIQPSNPLLRNSLLCCGIQDSCQSNIECNAQSSRRLKRLLSLSGFSTIQILNRHVEQMVVERIRKMGHQAEKTKS
jgi:hypothetical protein